MPCTRMAIPLRSIAPGEGHVIRPPRPRRFTLHDRFCETNPISAEAGVTGAQTKGQRPDEVL